MKKETSTYVFYCGGQMMITPKRKQIFLVIFLAEFSNDKNTVENIVFMIIWTLKKSQIKALLRLVGELV